MTKTLAQSSNQNILQRTRNDAINIVHRTSNKIFDLFSFGKNK